MGGLNGGFQAIVRADGVVEVSGDLDLATANELRAVIEPLAHAGEIIRVDAAGVRYADSSGLAVFLTVEREARRYDGGLVLIAMSDQVRNVLDVVGLRDRLAPGT